MGTKEIKNDPCMKPRKSNYSCSNASILLQIKSSYCTEKAKGKIFCEMFNRLTGKDPAAKLIIITEQCNEFQQIFTAIAQNLNKNLKMRHQKLKCFNRFLLLLIGKRNKKKLSKNLLHWQTISQVIVMILTSSYFEI